MKIYPGKHKITQVDKVNLDIDIPLAYIDTGYKDYAINIIPQLATERSSKVIPYTAYDSLNVRLFDGIGNQVDNTAILQRDHDKYYYIPQNAVSFMPQRFNYTVIGKKHMSYKSNKSYDFKVACIDTDQLIFAKQLMKIFGDAPDRNLCPKNVTVNSKDISVQSLINSSIRENDFIFIQSPDGVNYASGGAIDFDTLLNEHTNVWVSIDTFPYPMESTSLHPEITGLSSPMLYSNIKLPDKVFNLSQIVAGTNETYHNIFNSSYYSGVLIKEITNKGFVIIAPRTFTDNIEDNINLMYEIMMYVYANTYIESDKINEWIADVIPDYIVLNNRFATKDKFTSNMEINKIFGLDADEVSLSDISIDAENVRYTGIANNYIVFQKLYTGDYKKYADPAKPEGSISVFTPRQNIIYYKDFIYEIEESVADKIICNRTDYILQFNIKPFKNSLKNINIIQDVYMEYSLTEIINSKQIRVNNANLYIVCKENVLNLVDKKTYNETDGIIIAEVQISLSENKSMVYDMRQRGGGLPESMDPPSFSLLDIGNIYGMSYRKAGTLIITLPKRLQPFDDIITAAVKKHMVGEELPIILFEDKEE